MGKVFIIAEAGVNHNGRFDLAIELCNQAKRCGADAVKFQTFKTEKILTKEVRLADYQAVNTQNNYGSQYEMIKALELSFDQFILLKRHCDEIGIEFMSTPDDDDSLDFLTSLGLKRMKIGSAEADNLPFLRKIGKLNMPLILSTGMCDLSEVMKAVEVLMLSGTEKRKITVLHCNSEYPSPFGDLNLRAMVEMGGQLGVAYGYSDHSEGIEVPIAVTALGASIIEKHFTLDKGMEGPDHKASLSIDELEQLVRSVRHIEISMGSNQKAVSSSERKNRDVVRKVIVANRPIKKGEKYTVDNLTTKRAGKGLSPMLYWDLLIGNIAGRDYSVDAIVEM